MNVMHMWPGWMQSERRMQDSRLVAHARRPVRESRPAHAARRFACALSLIVAGLCVTGCHDPQQRGLRPEDGAELPILRQFIRDDSRQDRAMRLVVRDAAGWARLPLIDEKIDFTKEMALVVTMGRMIGEPHSLRVSRVWRDGAVLRVELAANPQPADAEATIAAPFCVAIVPTCDLNVEGFSPRVP